MTESVADKLIFAGVKLVILILVMLLGVGGEWLLHKVRKENPLALPHYRKGVLFTLGRQSDDSLRMLFGLRNFMVVAIWLCAIAVLLINFFGDRDYRELLDGLGVVVLAMFVSFTMTYLVRFLANAGYYFGEERMYVVRFTASGYSYAAIARLAQQKPIKFKRGCLRIPLPDGGTLGIAETDIRANPKEYNLLRLYLAEQQDVFLPDAV